MDKKFVLMNTFFGVALTAIGAAAGFIFFSKVYRDRVQDALDEEYDSELNALHAHYQKKLEELDDEAFKTARINLMKPPIDILAPEIVTTDAEKGIHLIHQDEFGEYYEYSENNLLYLADGNLMDKDGYKIANPSEILGDALDAFKDPENEYFYGDCIFVRNDDLQTYYEVIRDNQTFSEWAEENAYLGEV